MDHVVGNHFTQGKRTMEFYKLLASVIKKELHNGVDSLIFHTLVNDTLKLQKHNKEVSGMLIKNIPLASCVKPLKEREIVSSNNIQLIYDALLKYPTEYHCKMPQFVYDKLAINTGLTTIRISVVIKAIKKGTYNKLLNIENKYAEYI